ncbi:membrane protein insertase YidC [bacterium]|nr:membrane protein insertase YidC [bacterium]
MDKRTILAFVLIALVIIFWDDYLKIFGLAPETVPIDSTEHILEKKSSVSKTTASNREYSEREEFFDADQNELDEFQETQRGTQISEQEYDPDEEIITIETEAFIAKISSYGACLISYVLKPTRTYLKEDIELIPQNGIKRPGVRFWTYGGPFDTENLKYTIQDEYIAESRRMSVKKGREAKLTLSRPLGKNGSLEISYTFYGDGYSFLHEVKNHNLSQPWVRSYAETKWRGGIAYTEPDSAQDSQYSKAYVYYSGDILEDIKINTKKSEVEGPTDGTTHWGVVRTKYFMSAIIPELSKAEGAWMESILDSNYIGKYTPNMLGVGLNIPMRDGNPVTPTRIYLGPIDDDLLITIDPTLKQAMSMGVGVGFIDTIIRPISNLVLWSLKKLHKVVPNYGICIIIFSIIVKIVIWPLTRKSYQSMAAMQRLQPKLKELKEKYKDDAKRIQMETMKMYKTEKVNPMGGCLPMLLQMPLLYALFIVFRATIEFRRAPFMLWISDLSLPDTIINLPFHFPLYGNHIALLPIVMGITTFFQSKSTMSDPNQKMLLYFMPIFLTLIFNNFPSGLTLYYTLFNIWTLVQQKITPPPVLAVDSDKKVLPKK